MTIENENKRASRRRFMTAVGAASLTFAAPAIVRAQTRKPLKVSVGRQPWAAGNSPVTQYMIANKTFERFAADAGYYLTADYRDYPSALPMVEAFVAANLDFGMWGHAPFVRVIGQNEPTPLITAGIMNSFGYTEDHYKGPDGEGAGILLPSVKKSPFYPDGYYLHRSFWIGGPNIIKNDPAVVTAFVLAQQDAVAKLSPMDHGQVSQLSQKYWELDPKLGAKVVGDEVLFQRGWCWPTEGDAQALLETSKFMVEGRMIPKPLAWSQVRDGFALAAPTVRAAYEKSGRKPDAAQFEARDAKDLRGQPVWEMQSWREHS